MESPLFPSYSIPFYSAHSLLLLPMHLRAGEMSDTYHSASTMAWPGEEETDFNFKPPAWEVLGETLHSLSHSHT